ncbi:MAG TPA: ADP-ribosylglycohydrolase family protein, partial [Candidatus Obscuribacterales bacterium]
WTDDTALALALSDAILRSHPHMFDPILCAENFVAWADTGRFGTRNHCFDIGYTTAIAIQSYKYGKEGNVYTGLTGKEFAGNGGIMRMAPAIIASNTQAEAGALAVQQSLLTHAAPEAIMYTVALAEELWWGKSMAKYDHLKLPKDTPRSEVMSGGYVKETYQCAWWAIHNTCSFEAALILAVNRGHDSDTVGAVTGQLAGRIYGKSSIPERWLKQLHQREHIEDTATRLLKHR